MKIFSEFYLSPLLNANLSRNGFCCADHVSGCSDRTALAGKDLIAAAQNQKRQNPRIRAAVIQLLKSKGSSSGIRSVIISPARELAPQINETFVKMAAGTGLRAAGVVSGLSEQFQIAGDSKGSASGDRHRRALIRLSQSWGSSTWAAYRSWRWISSDDRAHCRSASGQLADVVLFRDYRKLRPAPWWIITSLRYQNRSRLYDQAGGQIELRSYEVEQNQNSRSSIIFCSRTRFVSRIRKDKPRREAAGSKAGRRGVKTVAIHGGRSQNQRNQARGFQSFSYRVLVAIDVASRAFHVARGELRFAVLENIIHRVGRTAGAELGG